jgi:hypothetical protein
MRLSGSRHDVRMLVASIVLITLALVAYTTGVWTEHRSGTLGGMSSRSASVSRAMRPARR